MNLMRRFKAYVAKLDPFDKFVLVIGTISMALLTATFVNRVAGGLGYDFGVTVPAGYPFFFTVFAMISLGWLRRNVGRKATP